MHIPISSRISSTAPYAFAEVDKQVAILKEQGIEVIDFGVGDPKAPTPDFIVDELYAAAKRHTTSGYPSYVGSLEYRQACADYMQREFNVTLNAETEVMASIGSKESVFNFPLGFVDAGDTVICPTPGYPPYKVGTRFAGGEPYFVPLLPESDFLIDLDAIPEEVAQKAKIIWINYPNSPSGKLAPRDWLEKLVAWAHKYNVIIAADEGCYIDIYFDEKPISILEVAKEGIVVFYSLSKRNNMTGYRAGFVAGDAEILAAFKKVKTNVDSGCPSFVQEAAIAALNDTQHAQEMRDEYRQKRDILQSAFRDIGLPECQSDGTFYIWQKAPDGLSGADLAQKFLKQGIVVTPGGWISDETESGVNPGENFVRFALVPTIEEVREAAERMNQIAI